MAERERDRTIKRKRIGEKKRDIRKTDMHERERLIGENQRETEEC